MPKWILITLAFGGYFGMWILTAWLLSREPGEDLTGDVIWGLIWPVLLAAVIIISPVLLVRYIVSHMPGNK